MIWQEKERKNPEPDIKNLMYKKIIIEILYLCDEKGQIVYY